MTRFLVTAMAAAIVAMSGFGLLLASDARAVGFEVDVTSADAVDANPGDGVCDDGSGLCPLRAAAIEANALSGADTIEIPDGTVALSIPIGADDESDGDIDITEAVEIVGAGMGQTIVEQILSGSAADRIFEIDVPDNETVTLRGLQVSGGAPDPATAAVSAGGGILVRGQGAVELERVHVTGNEIVGAGRSVGGGISVAAVASPEVRISDSTIEQNVVANTDPLTVASGDAPYGGGIAASGGTLAELHIDGSRIVDNVAVAASNSIAALPGGGGVRVAVHSFRLEDSVVAGNSAGRAGGLFMNVFGAPGAEQAIRRSTVAGNTASEGGGGALVAYGIGDVELANTTVTGNDSAKSGQAVFLGQSTVAVSLDSSTVVDNGVSISPALSSVGASFTLRRTILDNGAENCGNGSFASQGDNLFGQSDPDCGASPALGDQDGVAPLLVGLAENGGPTPTMALDPLSPARDAAEHNACPPPAIDQRGLARPAPAAGACDIGAYEYTDADADGVEDGLDNCAAPNPGQVDSDGDGVADACEPPLPAKGPGSPSSIAPGASSPASSLAPASATWQRPAETGIEVRIRGGRVRLSRNGVVRVRLACRGTEASGLCRGRLTLRTRAKLSFRGKRRRLVLARARVRIPVGQARRVRLRIAGPKARRVRADPRARRALIGARVRDAAGNRATEHKAVQIRIRRASAPPRLRS